MDGGTRHVVATLIRTTTCCVAWRHLTFADLVGRSSDERTAGRRPPSRGACTACLLSSPSPQKEGIPAGAALALF